MRFAHLGSEPRIHPDAVVAPTAVVSGDVTIGPGCQVLHGAVLTAEGSRIVLGENTIVMENALLRASSTHAVHVGAHTLIGPMTSVAGAEIGDEVFLATGTRVFNGAEIGDRCEVRINAVVHLGPCCLARRSYRSGGWPSAIPCRSSRPTARRDLGRPEGSSTSPATSSVSTARHRISWCSSPSAMGAASRATRPTAVSTDADGGLAGMPLSRCSAGRRPRRSPTAAGGAGARIRCRVLGLRIAESPECTQLQQ